MRESVHKFRSNHLQNERSVWIGEPNDRRGTRNLTIFLDAELYRDRVGAMAVIGELQGVIADSWFVFVSMESAESRWRECPCHPPFAGFITEELLPWLETLYEDLKLTRQRVLVGLSYTGLAAAFVAKEHPGAFQKVISQSGSFWSNDCWLVEQFRSLPRRIPTEFYLDVGTREIHENVRHREDVLQVMSQIEGVRRFRDVLLGQGYAVKHVEFEGGHDFEAWRKTLPAALKWALPLQP